MTLVLHAEDRTRRGLGGGRVDGEVVARARSGPRRRAPPGPRRPTSDGIRGDSAVAPDSPRVAEPSWRRAAAGDVVASFVSCDTSVSLGSTRGATNNSRAGGDPRTRSHLRPSRPRPPRQPSVGGRRPVRRQLQWFGGERVDVVLGALDLTLFTRAIYEGEIDLPDDGFLHVATFTDDLDREIEGHDVIWGPAEVSGVFGTRRIVFVDAAGQHAPRVHGAGRPAARARTCLTARSGVGNAAMTDVPRLATSIPSRLNVTVPQVDPLMLRLVPLPETCRLGSVRASALSFVIDAVAGVTVDSDPDHWTFTSDMSVRMNPVPAPDLVDGTAAVLRRGKRSATTEARLVDAPWRVGRLRFPRLRPRAAATDRPGEDHLRRARRRRSVGTDRADRHPVARGGRHRGHRRGESGSFRSRSPKTFATRPGRCRVPWSPSSPRWPPRR